MAIYKCKSCGGPLELQEGQTTITCDFCGITQTVPTAKDENLQNLFNRANTLRLKSEFDKAEQLYERILQADETQAEAYWGLILCKFGIEYVEDPATFKRVPTCHRTSYDAIVADDDYKSALQYADSVQRGIYEAEAKEIDRIQKEIIALSEKESSYDVFICYKETDSDGKRTQDSVIANDIYYQLTQEGFKVFYAAITLEDKLGSAYEPCIFAALNSAKVMLAIGTQSSYFDAVWVKNEWSRYLKLMKKDRSKLLIPCYRDMDAYELPEEFSHMQAQDTSKIGFINDLVRGIKKVITPEAQQPAAAVARPTASNTVAPLLRRAFMFLEDGAWQDADEYCERVLDQDPENAQAYLGKLMAEIKCRKQENLKHQTQPFDGSSNYRKALQFADAELKSELEEDIRFINNRNLETAYKAAVQKMNAAKTEKDFKAVAMLFEKVLGYEDADALMKECFDKAEIAYKADIYNMAKEAMQKAKSKKAYLEAAKIFEQIPDFQDAQQLEAYCKTEAENMEKNSIYKEACSDAESSYIPTVERAIQGFMRISGWKDADEQIQLCEERIKELEAKAEQERAAAVVEKKKKIRLAIILSAVAVVCIAFIVVLTSVIIPNGKYNDAVALLDEGKTVEAYEALIALNGYKDSAEKASSIYEEYEVEKIKSAEVYDKVFFGTYEQDGDTANGNEAIEWLVLDKKDGKALVISKYALDCQQYNTSDTKVTWETCSLRKWLNGSFLSAAFSEAEKTMIPTVTVSADKNPEYGTNPGNATQDKVFLLSITEVNKYFSSDSAGQCQPTAYAESQGAWVAVRAGCRWWLRSPGDYQADAACVDYDGPVSEGGSSVSSNRIAVRPALWIDLNS